MTDRADSDAAAIRGTASIVVEAILRLLDEDPHDFTSRPCQTCRAVTSLAGRAFGCVRVAKSMECHHGS